MHKPMSNLEIAKSAYQTWLFATTGCWLGSCFWRWWDYTARQELYAANSAPWWVVPLIYTLVYAVQMGAATVFYWAVRRWLTRREKH